MQLTSPDTSKDGATKTISFVVIVTVLAIHASGRTTPFTLGLLTLAIAFIAMRESQLTASFAYMNPVTAAFAALTAYMAVSGLWAPDGFDAFSKALLAMSFLLGAHFVAGWLPLQQDGRIANMAFWFTVAYAMAATYLLVEFLFDQEMKRQVLNALGLRPRHAYFTYDEHGIKSISPNALARSTTVLVMVLWPALLCCRLIWRGRTSWIACAVIFAIVAAATFTSRSDSNKLALLGGSAIFVAFALHRVTTQRLIAVVWIGAVLAMLPLAIAAFDARFYHSKRIPKSAQDRVVIWGHTAKETLKSPIIGAGAHAAYWLNRKEKRTAKTPPGGHRQVMTLSTHAHNVYLQIWYELGMIGVLLFLAVGLVSLNRISQLETKASTYAATTFFTVMIIIFSTWGAFQYWFMAAFALTAIALALGNRMLKADRSPDWPPRAVRHLRDDVAWLFGRKRNNGA